MLRLRGQKDSHSCQLGYAEPLNVNTPVETTRHGSLSRRVPVELDRTKLCG
jgi:hypothetical protein